MARLGAQISAVVSMNLRSIPSRASISLVTLVAVAVVVSQAKLRERLGADRAQ